MFGARKLGNNHFIAELDEYDEFYYLRWRVTLIVLGALTECSVTPGVQQLVNGVAVLVFEQQRNELNNSQTPQPSVVVGHQLNQYLQVQLNLNSGLVENIKFNKEIR